MRSPLKTRLDKLEQSAPAGETIDFIYWGAVEPGTMKQTLIACWPMPHAKAKGLRCEECGQDELQCGYDVEATGR